MNLITVAAKAAVQSAIQQPMDGVAGLVGLTAPKLIGDQPKYDFNTPEWYASTVGHGVGAMVPFLATSKTTGLFAREATVGKAILDGAVSGYVFTPGDAASRMHESFSSGVMFGTQHKVAEGLSGFAFKSAPLASRMGINAISGTAGGIASLESTSLVTGNGLVTDKQALLENTIAAMATTFALDGARAGISHIAARTSIPEISTFPGAATANGIITAPDLIRVADRGKFIQSHEQIGTWETPDAKQFQAESGKTFWQTPDGRIFHTVTAPGQEVQAVWTPHSTWGGTNAVVDSGDVRVWQRHEPQGMFMNQGDLRRPDVWNMYEREPHEAPEMTAERDAKLAARLPVRLEPDQLAQARILPTANGKNYERVSINTSEDTTISGRRYWILSANGAMELAGMNRGGAAQVHEQLKDMATPVIVPESYARKLDKIRELRATATQDPMLSDSPEAVLKARRELFLSPYGDRFLPEHWGQFIDTLPNPRLMSRLELWDHESTVEGRVAEAEDAIGVVRVFGDNNGVHLDARRTMLHEWTHLVETSQPTLRAAFEAASNASMFYGRDYATTSPAENWAVHFGEMLMDPNPELFMTLAYKSPIRTVMLAEALRRELANAPEGYQNAPEMQARLDYVDEHVLPEARKSVTDLINQQNIKVLRSGMGILEALSTNEHDIALRDKLFDLQQIKNFASGALEDVRLGKDWDTGLAIRGLLRTEVAKQYDPVRGQAVMRSDGNRVAAKLTTMMHADLHSGDPVRVNDAITLAGELHGTELAKRIIIPDDLLDAARSLADSDPETAQRAFDLWHHSENADVVLEHLRPMIAEAGGMRPLAASLAMESVNNELVWDTANMLREQLESGDNSAFTPRLIDGLTGKIDFFYQHRNRGEAVDDDFFSRSAARMLLLSKLAEYTPELMQDEGIRRRVDRAEKILAPFENSNSAADTSTGDSTDINSRSRNRGFEPQTSFEQRADGRIIYTEKHGDNDVIRVWSPFGARNGVSAYIDPQRGDMGQLIWKRHDAQGFYLNQLRLNVDEHVNDYKMKPLSIEDQRRFALTLPARVEPDSLAAARILPNAGGKPYETTTMVVQDQPVPARRYSILSAEGAMQLSDLQKTGNADAASLDALKQHATTILIPESYAQELDKVREIREIATLDPEESDNPQAVLNARRDLFLSPMRDRLLPEHWGQFIDGLPNPKLIRQIEFMPHQDASDAIMRSYIDEGRILVYGDNNSVEQHVLRTMRHEWGHLAEASNPDLRSAYDAAVKLSAFTARDYAKKNTSENWTVHLAEMLMDPNPELFMTVAHRAPIQSVILAEALRRELQFAPESFYNKQELQARLDYIEESVLPRAKAMLGRRLASSSVEYVAEAAELLSRLGYTEADRALRDELVDTNAIAKKLGSSRVKDLQSPDKFDDALAARTLIRYDLLKKLAPEQAGKVNASAMQRVETRLITRLSTELTSGDSDRSKPAIQLADQMSETDLYRRVLLPEDLLKAARHVASYAGADRAFEMYTKMEQRDNVRTAALDMLKGDYFNRQVALKWLIQDNDSETMWKTFDIVRAQFQSGDTSSVSLETEERLVDVLDNQLEQFFDGRKPLSDPMANRTYVRGRMLEEYLDASPELKKDPRMQALMQRVFRFIEMTRLPS